MKKNYLLNAAFSLFLIGGTQLTSTAQLQVAPGNPTIINDVKFDKSANSINKALTVCGTDTIDYPLRKASAIAALGVNSGSATEVGQYYNASGSITVNGVSLTVVNSKKNTFSVAIIPYTYTHTNFSSFTEGTLVNLEFDVIGKYVARLIKPLF